MTREDLGQSGKLSKVSGAGVSDLDFVRFWIMADYGAAVGRTAHIEFESIATMRQSQIEGRDCVLGNRASSASPAMAEQQHAWILAEAAAPMSDGSPVHIEVRGRR